MATTKRKVMLPHTMGQQGMDIVRARDDIETVIYPAGIGQAEFLPMLEDCAGIALSGTPYKQTEMAASPAMQVVARIGVGYDAVEVPAGATLAEVERDHIIRVLRETNGVVSAAATRLGLPRTTLNAMMRKLDVSRKDL